MTLPFNYIFKNILLAISIMLISISCIYGQPGAYYFTDDCELFNLKGKVSHIEQKCFAQKTDSTYIFNNSDEIWGCGIYESKELKFDSACRLISIIKYIPDSNAIVQQRTLTYLDNNTVEEYTMLAMSQFGSEEYVSKITYNKTGKVISEYTSQIGKDFTSNDTLVYSPTGDLLYKETYSKGKLLTKVKYRYYDGGKRIVSIESNRITNPIYAYYLNKNDKLLKRELYYDSTLVQIMNYEYDQKQNVIMYEVKDLKENTSFKSSYKYEYDSNDNWIKCQKIENGKVRYITLRKIKYY